MNPIFVFRFRTSGEPAGKPKMNPGKLREFEWHFDRIGVMKQYYEFLMTQMTYNSYELGGLRFVCPPGVYHPDESSSTRLMWRGVFANIDRFGNQILEVGTGCGALGICLAASKRDVTMSDIDPKCISCSIHNAKINRVNANIIHSDLFDSIGPRRFDSILFNTPLIDKAREDPVDMMTCDQDGSIFLRFMQRAKQHLVPGGNVCVNVSNVGNRKTIFEALKLYSYEILLMEYQSNINVWRCVLLARPI